MTPFQFGKEDAREDRPFCPESVFVRESQKADYTMGFLSVKPNNAAALAAIGGADVAAALLRRMDEAVDAAQATPSWWDC